MKLKPKYTLTLRETYLDGRVREKSFSSDGWSHMNLPFASMVEATLEIDALSPPQPEVYIEVTSIATGEVLASFTSSGTEYDEHDPATFDREEGNPWPDKPSK